MEVLQEIHYANTTSHELQDIVLMVEPNRYTGAFDLHDLTWGDDRPVEGYALEGGILRLTLPEPLAPGDGLSLKMAYTLHIPEREGFFGYTERQTNLGDWYPFVPPYDEERGWLAHEPNYYQYGTLGEHLAYDSVDFEVAIDLGETAEGVTLAASAPADVQGGVHHFQVQSARNFTWSASSEYVVRERVWEGVTIRSVFFPEHAASGEAALEIMQDSLEIYGRLFSPYRHETLTMVEGEFPDGAEFDGLFFLSEYYHRTFTKPPYNYFTILTAHETAHQWWYGLVGSDQALEPWLDEMLATYCERIYLENIYPKAVLWWHDFRIDTYHPQGWVNSTIYDFEGFRPYVNAVYLRGASFMDELRVRIGDEAFFAFLKAYAEGETHAVAGGESFWGRLEGYELEGLVDEYFR